jgi:DNA-binding MarR family transcriptional regulator
MMSNEIKDLRKLSQQYAYASILMHETIARKAGFSSTDHKYLGIFLQKGTLTAGELAELTGLTTGAVTGLIDRFEKRSLIRRQFDKTDRRKVVITPYPEKITALLEPLYQDFQAANEELIASFTGSERAVIESYLQKALELARDTTQKFK